MPPPRISPNSRIDDRAGSVADRAGSWNTRLACSILRVRVACPPTKAAGAGAGTGVATASPNQRSARASSSPSSTAPDADTTIRSGEYSRARQASTLALSAGFRLSTEPRIGRPSGWPVKARVWTISNTWSSGVSKASAISWATTSFSRSISAGSRAGRNTRSDSTCMFSARVPSSPRTSKLVRS